MAVLRESPWYQQLMQEGEAKLLFRLLHRRSKWKLWLKNY
jgi:hypothetical protein